MNANTVVQALKSIEVVWEELFPIEQARITKLLIKEVVVTKDGLDIRIGGSIMENLKVRDEQTLSVFVPMEIKKKGGAAQIIAQIILPKNVEAGAEVGTRVYDPKMMTAFAKAYKWKMMLKSGKVRSLADICKKENISTSYSSRIYRLNFVAPKIVEAIVNGKQPSHTASSRLFMGKPNPIPDLWEEQLEAFGFKE